MDEEDDDVDNTNMLDTFKMMLRDFIHKAELDFVKRQPQECASLPESARREEVSVNIMVFVDWLC